MFQQQPGHPHPLLPNLLFDLSRQKQRQLLGAFWIVALSLIGYELFWARTGSSLSNIGAVLITVSALLPGYLWCSGQAQGMPIFPFFALTYIWTYGLPLVINHPKVITYSPESQLSAALTTSGFLLLGTWVWFQFVKSPSPLPPVYRALDEHKGDRFFLMMLATAVLFNLSANGGWLQLSGGLLGTIRNAVLGLTALASFVLAYRTGTQELTKQQSRLFIILLVSYMLTSASGLLLIGASSTFLISTIAFVIGRKKVPILPIVLMLICLSFLHYGKAEMRSKYWGGQGIPKLQPWDYPAWYSEWAGYSLEYFGRQEEELSKSEEKESFLVRSSVIQMLLLAQSKSPETVPYLYGKTYAILPQVVIPRVLNPSKIRTTEGTHILSVHYGLQTYEKTFTTSISWGLLAESYGNFGVLGCAGLAVVLGWAYGKVTRWSLNAPILSAQSLFSVIMMTFALQTEWTAGVYVAALYQTSTVLGGIVFVLMRSYSTMDLPMMAYRR
ncbi:hypothetical protein HJG54_30975 [Leptolyngbya sp. NK1-12]|uniref:O-antigen polysaccharide polymerase Wzy n=2 Tax=Leptolyngbya sp. NK1-12 TaxID=2547451 RepID=A0AA96WLY8_9CYAN|nr:hypothetical protein HJG54_30975 [Leptolyngbya sp. NK1-12]